MKKKEAVFIIVENLHTSIEGLQTTIAKQNLKIAELQYKIDNPGFTEEQAVKKSYEYGWKDCAETIIAKTTETIGSLNRLQTAAVTLYGRKREND